MGLDTTHNCWHGAYSAFMRFRRCVAKAAGIDLDKMEGFGEEGVQWDTLRPSPLWKLLHHSDCDGEIAPEDCAGVADALEDILPKLPETGEGHLSHGVRAAAEQWIKGLRAAAAAGEPVKFH